MAGNTFENLARDAQKSLKSFSCPKCGAQIKVRAAGQSVTAVCSACNAIIDAQNENLKIIKKSQEGRKRNQVLELGQRGTLKGILWEVIGYMERGNSYDEYWSEYLLFNPRQGFRWLTEFNGHWNFVVMTKGRPGGLADHSMDPLNIEYLGKNYRLFNKYSAETAFISGEFYWKVKTGNSVNIAEYVRPPELLTSEADGSELIWSVSEYIEPAEVKKGFSLQADLRLRIGTAPNQPSATSENARSIYKWFAMFTLIIIVLQFGFCVAAKNRTILIENFDYKSTHTERLRVTSPFELEGGYANLEIKLSAPVDNNWVELAGSLVNDDTGEAEEFELGAEYYSGYDSDGFWSEGDRRGSLILSSIREGKYHLNLEASGTALPSVSNLVFEQIITPEGAVPRTSSWPNGKVKSFEPLLSGKLEGVAKYFHENGRISHEVGYRNGEKYGNVKHYRDDGSLEAEENYLNGRLVGTSKWYDADGDVVQVKYHDDNSGGFQNLPIEFEVRRDVETWSNFLWSLALLTVIPVIISYRDYQFEVARWEQSDFSPYSHHFGGDD